MLVSLPIVKKCQSNSFMRTYSLRRSVSILSMSVSLLCLSHGAESSDYSLIRYKSYGGFRSYSGYKSMGSYRRSSSPVRLSPRSNYGIHESSSVRVRSSIRRNGSYVQSHRRSYPTGNKLKNWSTKGNVNPYTGKKGTKDPFR